MLHDLAQDTTIAATDNQNPLGVGVGVHGEVGNHLLVGEFIALGALDDVVQDEDSAVVGRLEDEDILVLALLVVQDLLDSQSHGLAYHVHRTVRFTRGLVRFRRPGPEDAAL